MNADERGDAERKRERGRAGGGARTVSPRTIFHLAMASSGAAIARERTAAAARCAARIISDSLGKASAKWRESATMQVRADEVRESSANRGD